jgi:succinate dehydrogenase / fumarate reductase, cytochrome b subunit
LQANYAAITIRYGGAVIFFFVIYHLMHLTWGVPVIHNEFHHGDAYHNVVAGFQSIPNVIIYTIAVIALGLHLYHGTWSMFQTLGLNNRTYDRLIRGLALALAVIIPVGFIIVPYSVLFGFVS